MNIKKNHPKLPMQIGVLLAPLLALIGIILQCTLLLGDYDASSGYFAGASVSALIMPAFFIATAIVLLICTLIIRRCIPPAPDNRGLTVLFSGAFLSVALAVAALCTALALPATKDGYLRFISTVALIGAISSFIYIALTLRGDRFPTLRAALSAAPTVYAMFAAMYLYFDKTMQMNAPVKLLQLVSYLILACYSLSECRNVIGRKKPALNFFTTSLALVFCGVASVPSIVYTAVHNTATVLSVAGDFVLFAFFLYILARLIQLLPIESPKLHSMVGVILNREEETATEEVLEEEEELEQESFDFSEEEPEEKVTEEAE